MTNTLSVYPYVRTWWLWHFSRFLSSKFKRLHQFLRLVMPRKSFFRYWPFLMGIHRSPLDYLYKRPATLALMLFLMLAWTNGWINRRIAGKLRHHATHCDVIIIYWLRPIHNFICLQHYRDSAFINYQCRIWQVAYQHNSTIHYSDVIMGAIAFQITCLAFVYSIAYSGADQRKHQSSGSLAFV